MSKATELVETRLADLDEYIAASFKRQEWLTEQINEEQRARQQLYDEYDELLVARHALEAALPTPREDYDDIPF